MSRMLLIARVGLRFFGQSYLDPVEAFRGGLDVRDAGGKSWYHRGNRGNVQFEEGRCRVENLSRSFR